MKNHYFLFFLLMSLYVNAQTFWTGPTITVTKADYADWTLPENQDALTCNVILTRADNRGIFNIAQESVFDNDNYTSPIDTEWAIGTIADGVQTLTFDTWDNTHMANPMSLIDVDVVLHLITDDIYIDTKITAWTSGGLGGGFTYQRSTKAPTFWTGPTITVTKADYADWTLPENQDALTCNVILTRADNRGIFNIAQESVFDNNNYTSPIDTEWAIGTIADGVETLTFDTWDITHMANPMSLIDVDVVLHLITDDIYIDTKITAWTSGGLGGGFTYQRSTNQSLSTNQFELNSVVKLFPNPSSAFIQVSGLTENQQYKLYNILGAEIKNGFISINGQIDISSFTNGLYFMKFGDGKMIKFIKK